MFFVVLLSGILLFALLLLCIIVLFMYLYAKQKQNTLRWLNDNRIEKDKFKSCNNMIEMSLKQIPSTEYLDNAEVSKVDVGNSTLRPAQDGPHRITLIDTNI